MALRLAEHVRERGEGGGRPCKPFEAGLFTVDPYPGPGGGTVVFFEHVGFVGASTQALGPGDYTLADLIARGFVNDWASSVRVGPGRVVTMYEHDNFEGLSWTVAFDVEGFPGLSPSANDLVSSVRIR